MKFCLQLFFTIVFFLLIVTKSFSQDSIALNKMIYMDSTYTETTEDNYLFLYKLANKNFGKIYLSFVVDTRGNLVEPKIIKGIGYGLDEIAIRLIKEAKTWNPGLERGIPIRVLYSLPITFAK